MIWRMNCGIIIKNWRILEIRQMFFLKRKRSFYIIKKNGSLVAIWMKESKRLFLLSFKKGMQVPLISIQAIESRLGRICSNLPSGEIARH